MNPEIREAIKNKAYEYAEKYDSSEIETIFSDGFSWAKIHMGEYFEEFPIFQKLNNPLVCIFNLPPTTDSLNRLALFLAYLKEFSEENGKKQSNLIWDFLLCFRRVMITSNSSNGVDHGNHEVRFS